ncbi:gp16 family protein [Psychrobacter lutiphocae]|uniref:gp16 family protein n=1 Tax=Psychrobacter lutiphocae TaxID=540500 RepID=UPI0003802427|nr:regulatory protein GemA [Psychrobacter lutiphocae]
MTTKYTPTKPKLIQLIHIGKSKLGLDDGTYRHMLTELTGKDSTKKMTKPELLKVLDNLRDKGFTPAKPKRAGKLKQACDPQSKLIRSLWLELHDAGAVRNPSERALASYVERQTGKSALQFLSTKDASQVIESLKKWLNRL